ncbi:MAG: enoyl-CoA hydratase/isomerase family protein [Alphaproteobacteria bacterium]|jgi:enoyl-CoA hydratase|nr:enoyl-CoA hydratase [Rhodospirillaceae bacterium]MDP6020723.1 enoyl-CoA hydratase/isomerase family protein [Alphaproteobacteria bacterium]MDP6255471.1 enoyl-CoA hydratase/isomerase family protein [Alphaproteobacteria bacterium]MDP7055938.1 enoyl-CoA hydratase/isomerase family protein [Alphaproteobacteria bacterium]MDP7231181.1 enoyl-CoA hydratase/isomerase family protein [Alphaproteobacteria bacterium]|tara:strand:- start:2473 stop:3258 length:786 start_codon:yes stop_codon:yes gene_type:complete
MSGSGNEVLQKVVDGVGIMTLNRPEKFNCISSGLMDGMANAIEAFDNDPNVRVILLDAVGKTFCTGADLDEVMAARKDRATLSAFISRIHEIFRRMETSPLPVVVSINGLALAGGIEMMMAADVAFAAKSAQIGDQHAQYGLIPGGGGTQRLPRLVGLRRALDLMYTNKWLSAEEAENWGLVNYVVANDALADTALDYCRNLAQKSRTGLTAMKHFSRQGMEVSPSDGLTLEEEEVINGLLGSDVEEGLEAFQARRKPNFA